MATKTANLFSSRFPSPRFHWEISTSFLTSSHSKKVPNAGVTWSAERLRRFFSSQFAGALTGNDSDALYGGKQETRRPFL